MYGYHFFLFFFFDQKKLNFIHNEKETKTTKGLKRIQPKQPIQVLRNKWVIFKRNSGGNRQGRWCATPFASLQINFTFQWEVTCSSIQIFLTISWIFHSSLFGKGLMAEATIEESSTIITWLKPLRWTSIIPNKGSNLNFFLFIVAGLKQ